MTVSNTFIPVDLADKLYNRQTPWLNSPETNRKLQPIPSSDPLKYRAYKIVSGPECDFATRYFLANKPHGFGIKEIEIIDNPTLKKSFESNLVTMNVQAQNPMFAPTWERDLKQTALRRQVIEDWEKSIKPFSPITTSDGELINDAKVLPLMHGSSEAKAQSICSIGFVYFGKHFFFNPKMGLTTFSTDQGFFGSGIYLTDSFEYAKKYSKDGIVVLCWVAHRSPLPVVSDVKHPRKCSDMSLLEGREKYLNHNMHVIPIAKVKDALYYPCYQGQKAECKEYVVFDSAQVLPWMLIRLTPDGPAAPLGTTYSIEEFYQACQKGDMDRVRTWVQEDTNRLRAKNNAGENYLFPAVFGNQIAVLDWLYRQDSALLKSPRTDNSSILHAAMAAGYAEICKWILHHAPEMLHLPNEQGDTPLFLAAYFEQKEILELYIDEVKKDPQIVLKLSQTPNYEVLRFLADKGVSLQVVNKQQQSPLHLAAAVGQLQNVELLLDRGIALDAKDKNERTPLFLAVTQGHERVVQFLINQGARVDCVAIGGETLFHTAAFYGYSSLLEILLPRAAHLIEQADEDGKTPLHKAVWGSPKPQMVEWLLAHGANANAKNFNRVQKIAFNYTPLHWAAKHGHVESARILLEKGAQLDVTNFNGETPLELAIRFGQDGTARFLIDPHANSSQEALFLVPPTKKECLEKLKQKEDEILCLEKLAEICLEEKDYLGCSRFLCHALTLAVKRQLVGYQTLIFKKLEKIEGQFIHEKFGTKLSSNQTNYLGRYINDLADMQKSNPKSYADQYQQLISKAIKQCIDMVQNEAQTPFLVVGFGDFARGEIMPYQIAALGIIAQNKDDYISSLANLVQLRIAILSGMQMEDVEKISASALGIQIETPEKFEKGGEVSCLLWGDKKTYDTYQKGLQDFLNHKPNLIGKSRRQAKAIEELQKITPPTLSGSVSFSKYVYVPFFQMICQLGLYFGIEQIKISEIIAGLGNKNHLIQADVKELELLYRKLFDWRWQLKKECPLSELIEQKIATRDELVKSLQIFISFYRLCQDVAQHRGKTLVLQNTNESINI